MADPTLVGIALGIAGGVLVLAAVAVLLRRRAPRSPAAGPRPPAPHDDEGPPVLEHDVLHLRCGTCGTTFDVPDTGQRPLVHVCPGCGHKGLLSARDLSRHPE